MRRQRYNKSRDRFASSRGTCAHSVPYCVVTGTHWRFTQSSPRRDFGIPMQPGDGYLQFLNNPSSSLPHLNEGAKCYANLVNVPKTSLVKLIYCMGMGSIPIGANTSPVDSKLIFFQGDGNMDLGPPQGVCLPDTMFEPKMAAVMTVAQLSTIITSKGAGYSYPLLARNAVNMSGETMQISPITLYFVCNQF